MIHKCEKKIGPIQECLIDRSGNIYCKSCGKKLKEDQIEPKCLRKIKDMYKND